MPHLQPKPCLGNVPLYPWASSCFPEMLVELKEQNHSNPMTGEAWEGLNQAQPWEPQPLCMG